MDTVDNNQFEVKPVQTKRKVTPNVYLNPALDLLANEDPMCNNAMEIPIKKRKRSKSADIAVFENSALDLGISRAAVNEFLVRELRNVCDKNLRHDFSPEADIAVNNDSTADINEPIYSNLTVTDEGKPFNVNQTENARQNICEESGLDNNEIDTSLAVLEQKSLNTAVVPNKASTDNLSVTNIQANVTNQLFINNSGNLNLSFIDRLALDSPNVSNQSLYFDDDLNESNIMEIKTITIITKKKKMLNNTNPFLDPNLEVTGHPVTTEGSNPFLVDLPKPELEYSDEVVNRPPETQVQTANLMPRRLFSGDSTISTVNESSINIESHEYENVDGYRAESPIYENADELDTNYNKQSKILGHDVSHFSAVDILNLNKNSKNNLSNESNDSKKDLKHHLLKASNKLSKKVLKTLKKTFKTDKPDLSVSSNPYEVPRKLAKLKTGHKDAGIENPGLNLDVSDEIQIEELDEEHQYETIKTIRNTQLNMNVTPLRENTTDNIDVSHNKTNTPGKKVRFDSTLNREKVITGNSFDCGIQSPGFDAKIDKYHDELENCINERKILEQNM